jgi:superfamily II DNA/RNA helicase
MSLVQAPTGSGKTLAFLLPLAARLVEQGHDAQSRPAGPLALVLAPTRELAVQTLQAAKPLRPVAGLRAVCVHGAAGGAAAHAHRYTRQVRTSAASESFQ